MCVCVCVCCHPQTDCLVISQLFSEARHVRPFKLGLKGQLYVRLSIVPLSPTDDPRQVGNYKALCSSFRLFTFCLTGYQSAQFIRRALHYASGNRKFLRQSAQPQWGSVYIVIHRQTVSLYHNSSVWLDT